MSQVRRSPLISRRTFTAGAATLATAVAPRPAAAARARRLADETIVGEGEHTFRAKHDFPQLPGSPGRRPTAWPSMRPATCT